MLRKFILTCTEGQDQQQVKDIKRILTKHTIKRIYKLFNHYIPLPDELLPQARIPIRPIQVCKTHICPIDKSEIKRTSKLETATKTHNKKNGENMSL